MHSQNRSRRRWFRLATTGSAFLFVAALGFAGVSYAQPPQGMGRQLDRPGRMMQGRAQGRMQGRMTRGGPMMHRGLSMRDLPASLNLTPDQQSRMENAINRLRDARRERFQKMRGHGAKALKGERPMEAFLVDTSNILSPDQFTTFTKFLAQRRHEMVGPRARMMRREFMQRFPRRAAQYLGLNREEMAQLRPVVRDHMRQIRDVRVSLRDKAITPDQARDQIKAIRSDLTAKMQSILTPEQWAKVQKFQQERSERWADSRLNRLGKREDQRIDFLSQVLQLSNQQKDQVKHIAEGTITQRKDILERVKNNSIQPEDAVFDLAQVNKTAMDQIRSVLNPDQTTRFDALEHLVRPGPALAMGMHPGMMGRMGPRTRGMGPGMGRGMGPGAGRGMHQGWGQPAPMQRRGWKS